MVPYRVNKADAYNVSIIYLQLGDSQWEKHLRIPTDVIMDLTEFIQQNDQFEFDSELYP